MLRALGISVLAVVIGVLAIPSAVTAEDCRRIRFPLHTVFTVSAAQAGDGRLVVLDYRQERLVVVNLRNGGWGAVGGWADEALKGRRPIAVRASAGGVLLEQAAPAKIVPLDEHLAIRPGTQYLVDDSRHADGTVLDSMWIWETAGDDVVACGDLYYGSGEKGNPANWFTGVVRFPLAAPAEFRTMLEFDLNDRTALGCRLRLPLIASVGERTYVLKLADVPRIVVSSPASPEPRPLRGDFPERFAFTPSLPTVPESKEVPFVLQELTKATMPAGIFGWEGQLYLLSRSPAANGEGTDWWLTRIDPETEEVVGSVRIGSRATHLMMVPGAEEWALIEKGPVDSFEDQDLESILVVPASEVRDWGSKQVICGSAAG